MNHINDTIAAISTPPGEGGIGIVRLSGSNAVLIADKVFVSSRNKRLAELKSHSLTHGFVRDNLSNKRIDEALVTVMRAPRTYTREDVVEINCHGGMNAVKAVMLLVLKEGARIAEPGEFTKRAFLNGRIDLSQAEAVIDIIRAKSDRAETLALSQLEGRLSVKISALRERLTELCAHIEAHIDFPEDGPETMDKSGMTATIDSVKGELKILSSSYEQGRLFREGISVAIVGKPNVGKSSLLNALLEKDRAIVTEIPGTTRDIIEDSLNINGLPVRIMDTAGIRDSHDLAEIEGVRRSLKAIDGADIIIAVLDASKPMDGADEELLEKVRQKRAIYLLNKIDNAVADIHASRQLSPLVRVSAKTGEGIERLKEDIYSVCLANSGTEGVASEELLITNLRHKQAIDKAVNALEETKTGLQSDLHLDFVAVSARESLDCLGEIVGAVTSDDILNRIFSDFCIGK
ncbi:MAG: tRNA uridine-5-carboxymethylaminomethyl(34) synthesis GTPase MnmE [Nitrospirae bacterium]|nr:MAG: tRNA uridine-5-carboxymethylaminomethyl(34) synthesis GTPase MnmE [Nitrospirota bacterium]